MVLRQQVIVLSRKSPSRVRLKNIYHGGLNVAGRGDVHVRSSRRPTTPDPLLKLDIDFEFFVGAAIADVIAANCTRRRKINVPDRTATVGDSARRAPETEGDTRHGLGFGNAIC